MISFVQVDPAGVGFFLQQQVDDLRGYEPVLVDQVDAHPATQRAVRGKQRRERSESTAASLSCELGELQLGGLPQRPVLAELGNDRGRILIIYGNGPDG